MKLAEFERAQISEYMRRIGTYLAVMDSADYRRALRTLKHLQAQKDGRNRTW